MVGTARLDFMACAQAYLLIVSNGEFP